MYRCKADQANVIDIEIRKVRYTLTISRLNWPNSQFWPLLILSPIEAQFQE
jgi:hypothetical protein